MLGGNRGSRAASRARRGSRGWDGGGARQHDGHRRLLGLRLAHRAGRDATHRRRPEDQGAPAGRGGRLRPDRQSGLVTQQIEGGLIWALAQATVPAPEWVAGMPRARRDRRDRPAAHRRHARDRRRADPEQRAARRRQRARRDRARAGRRQCDLRRHRQAHARAAVRPDGGRMTRPPIIRRSPSRKSACC